MRLVLDGWCACGRPLHYLDGTSRALVETLVAKHGPNVPTIAGGWRYAVPRHYIALHGIKATELAALAAKYGWPREKAS